MEKIGHMTTSFTKKHVFFQKNRFWCSKKFTKLALKLKIFDFLFDLEVLVEINYRPHRPHFRIAFFTSYNFFFRCMYRWCEKVGQKIHSLTSTHDFLSSKNQRSMFLTRFPLFSSMMIKKKVVAHIMSNIFIY